MIGRRWPGRDRGSFTAEFAAGLPAVLLLLLAGLTAVAAMLAKLQCVDRAREAAVAVARGEPAPPGVTVALGADTVTARVREPVRILGAGLPTITMEATAVAAREPQAAG